MVGTYFAVTFYLHVNRKMARDSFLSHSEAIHYFSHASKTHTHNMLIDVDWKSLTIPAILPITTDYLPDETTLLWRYKFSEHFLDPDVDLELEDSAVNYFYSLLGYSYIFLILI